MPVRFRCSECRSKLSIARRKIGTAVACPNCRQVLTVPGRDETPEEGTELIAVGSTSATGLVGRPHFPIATAKSQKPVDLEDMPLFERSDFERMLEPAVREAKESPEPAPRPPAPLPPARHTDGILILRSTATVLTAAVVVLMGLAFAAGFLMGSR